MKNYDFTLILDRAPTDDEVNALYEAGFDSDGIVIGGAERDSYIMAGRKAPTQSEAVELATAQAESCGLKVIQVRDLKILPGRPSLSKPGKRSPQLTVVVSTDIEAAIERDAKRLGIKKTQVARNILVSHYLKADTSYPKSRRKTKVST